MSAKLLDEYECEKAEQGEPSNANVSGEGHNNNGHGEFEMPENTEVDVPTMKKKTEAEKIEG